MKKKINLRFAALTLVVLLAALSRLIPHPSNFAPIGAMALFGAAYYNKRYMAYIIPVFSMWLSDLIINNVLYGAYFDHFVWFYSGSIFTYGAFALIVVVGSQMLKKIRIANIAVSTISASAIFFVVSNFGVWLTSGMYPRTLAGLTACYVAGIPFFHNTILGDAFYVTAMFGSFELCARYVPKLRLNTSLEQSSGSGNLI